MSGCLVLLVSLVEGHEQVLLHREGSLQATEEGTVSLVGSSHRNLTKVTATANNKKTNFNKDTKGAQLSDGRGECNGGMGGWGEEDS